MTLANRVTVGRLALIPLVLWTLFAGQRALSLALVAAFFLGDMLDGYLARSRNEITDLGKFLDPVADKLLSFSLVVAFALLGELSWWTVALLFVPNAVLFLGTLTLWRQRRPTVAARPSGKLAATVLGAGLIALYLAGVFTGAGGGLRTAAQWLVYGGIAAAVWAAADYVRVGVRRSARRWG